MAEIHVDLRDSAPVVERSIAISIGLDSALGQAGLFSVHAAGVVSPRGNGALFIGASGAGKTTLTLTFLKCGWRYLSDDQIALEETPRGVEAHGLRRLFSVVVSDIERLCGPMDIGALGPHPGRPDKRRVDGDRIFPGRFQRTVKPRALFFPTRHASPTRIAAIEPTAALTRLVKYSPWGARDADTASQQLAILKQLSTECPAFELFAGPDLATKPDSLSLLTSVIDSDL